MLFALPGLRFFFVPLHPPEPELLLLLFGSRWTEEGEANLQPLPDAGTGEGISI